MSIFTLFATYGDLALLVLRVAFGAVMLVHGWPKLRNLKKNAENFAAMGFRPGILFGTVAAFLEVFGGAAMIVGFAAQTLGALFVLELIVIVVWRIARQHAFVGGWEFELMLLAAAVVILCFGAGIYSVDASLLRGGF